MDISLIRVDSSLPVLMDNQIVSLILVDPCKPELIITVIEHTDDSLLLVDAMLINHHECNPPWFLAVSTG